MMITNGLMETDMIAPKSDGMVSTDDQSALLDAGMVMLVNGSQDCPPSNPSPPAEPQVQGQSLQEDALPDPAWASQMDFGNQLHLLAMADTDRSSCWQIKQPLERLAQYLIRLEPVEAILREQQIRDVLRAKRIKPAVALIKAAKQQAMKKLQDRRSDPENGPL